MRYIYMKQTTSVEEPFIAYTALSVLVRSMGLEDAYFTIRKELIKVGHFDHNGEVIRKVPMMTYNRPARAIKNQ